MIISNYNHEYLKHPIVMLLFVVCSAFYSTADAQNKKIDSLKNELKAHPEQNDNRALILLDLAVLNTQSNPNAALVYLDEIMLFQNKITKKIIVANTYRAKAVVQYYTSKFPEALKSLDNSSKIDNVLKNNAGIGKNLSTMGAIYIAQSKFPEALKHYLSALKFSEKNNDYPTVAIIRSNIGTIYNQIGNFEQAMDSYEKAYEIFKKLKHYPGQANTLANIGIIHSKNKNYNEAIKYSNLSLKIADSIGDQVMIGRENGNLSSYYSNIKQFDLALKYATKSIDINKKIGNKKSLGYNYQNVSSAYFGKKNYEKSKIYGINALNIGKELDITEIKRDASLGLSEVYEAIKMPDSSLFYFKEYTKFADSITNDKKKNEITRMGIQYEFDKKELTYQQNQLIADGQLKQQKLQLALNYAELQRSLQLRDLQEVQIENEKLISAEKEKQLLISKNNEKLQLGKVKALSQEQKLNRLELNQLWLYGILAVVILVSILIYLLNLYRIRQLRFKNTLQNQEAEQKALKLSHQYQLAESELKAIRSQMNPHFIFNVLNSIESYIMDNDKRTASRLVQKFASLSRLILENSTKSLVTADKEWKALTLYTELEAMRYNHVFSFNFIVDEKLQLKTLLLPPMLIQPLIENAILHGLIEENKPDAHLEVRLKSRTSGICITVTDNGLGINTPKKIKEKFNGIKEQSIGIESIKERIEIINQQENTTVASFNIAPGINDIGTIATICLPLLPFKPDY